MSRTPIVDPAQPLIIHHVRQAGNAFLAGWCARERLRSIRRG
jgi:hypothetical protein